MKNLDKIKGLFVLWLGAFTFQSCSDYLNIVPDNVATIDYAFRLRDEAEKYLFTCYNNLPTYNGMDANMGLMGSDELTTYYPRIGDRPMNLLMLRLGRGEQNVANPIMNYWDGSNGGKAYFMALRECNIFLENIGKVHDITEGEREKWKAEVKVLKAYYHYWLLRMYGPIPIIKDNLPISTSVEDVKVERKPIDEVFNYIIELIDEALPQLPEDLMGQAELGRINKAIALSIKAEVMVTRASPLFNGNQDMGSLIGKKGEKLFPAQNPVKWNDAATACQQAIVACEKIGIKLFNFQNPQYRMTDSTRFAMNIVGAVTSKWNEEIIWGASNSWLGGGFSSTQGLAMARLSPYSGADESQTIGSLFSAPLHMAEMFYSKNGVPIEEDKSYDYNGRYSTIRTAGTAERFYIRKGERTAQLNFDREPRFYGSMGFDKGIWFGIGKFNDQADNMWYIQGKAGENGGVIFEDLYNITGYWPKKLVHPNGSIAQTAYRFGVESYPWPILRLADLYLLYAEALNEASGPSADVFKYLDLVRVRSGLKGIVESWASFSKNPNKPQTKEGLRDIIHRERTIELAFEGKRFWDFRRWKEASSSLNRSIQGWNYRGRDEASYYRVQTIYQSQFVQRDYFWPLSESALNTNTNLVQNLGW